MKKVTLCSNFLLYDAHKRKDPAPVQDFCTRDLWNCTECHTLCKEVKIDVFEVLSC